MSKNLYNWMLFTVLSFIWGSCFLLMKLGLGGLNDYQVAALRIVMSGLVLLPTAVGAIKRVPGKKIFIIFLSGLLGSLLPAFLFCKAELGLDSALAGTLNALTPIFVIIIGALFFGSKTSFIKVLGIIVAFTGSVLLMLVKGIHGSQNYFYVGYIIIATICYGINVNMVSVYLKDIGALRIAAVALTTNAIPALAVLFITGFFNLNLGDPVLLKAIGYSAILGVMGTAVASILFYQLMKSAGPVFSSMVTYGIPIIAIGWGVLLGEDVTFGQAGCLLVILAGVFIANFEMLRTAARNRFGPKANAIVSRVEEDI